MGFRRLFGFGDDESDPELPEIDTQITTLAPLPGHPIEGEIVLKGGSRGIAIRYFYLRVVAKVRDYAGPLKDLEMTRLDARGGMFGVAPGAEERVPFSGRLPWECPVTELGGHTLGVDLSLTTQLDVGRESPVLDLDFLHVAAPPLYETVLDAFAEEGYRGADSQVIYAYIPGVEQHRPHYQTFFVTDPTRGLDRLGELEVVFLQNAVGAMVHVRRAARSQLNWKDKPLTRSFPAAHHEVGQVDFGERVRMVLAELGVVDG
ncbi:sporulation protein [Streptomyces sp. NPDC056227]|uniref:sporulation protein n=1 Tax=Streptomyces sp. NPDC056227 TaxID=3345753 RepID=UPI0035D6D63E